MLSWSLLLHSQNLIGLPPPKKSKASGRPVKHLMEKGTISAKSQGEESSKSYYIVEVRKEIRWRSLVTGKGHHIPSSKLFLA